MDLKEENEKLRSILFDIACQKNKRDALKELERHRDEMNEKYGASNRMHISREDNDELIWYPTNNDGYFYGEDQKYNLLSIAVCATRDEKEDRIDLLEKAFGGFLGYDRSDFMRFSIEDILLSVK